MILLCPCIDLGEDCLSLSGIGPGLPGTLLLYACCPAQLLIVSPFTLKSARVCIAKYMVALSVILACLLPDSSRDSSNILNLSMPVIYKKSASLTPALQTGPDKTSYI